uniref:Cyclic nucleotide-binding domain-containing protein n=1 Tax=Magallana gigas TaxID=29159 RepID=A0A8W8MTT8_MAGGI
MYTTQYHRQSPGFVPSGQGEGRGKMVTHSDIQFIKCLQKFPHQRTDQDLDLVYSYLHGMEALSSLREPALRALCRTVRYEYHDANDILYCQGELSTCWYILLSGSVFIEGSMFLPRSSWARSVTAGCVTSHADQPCVQCSLVTVSLSASAGYSEAFTLSVRTYCRQMSGYPTDSSHYLPSFLDTSSVYINYP